MKFFYEISDNEKRQNSSKLAPAVPTTFPPDMHTIARKFYIELGIMPFLVDGLQPFTEIIRNRRNFLRSHQFLIPFKTDPVIPISRKIKSENITPYLPTFPISTQNMGALPQMPIPTAINANSPQNHDSFIKSWEDPVRLFELLFRRLLCDFDRDILVSSTLHQREGYLLCQILSKVHSVCLNF